MHADAVREMPLSFTAHPRTPRREPWLRLLSQVLDLAGPNAQFISHAERAWASATFSGSRHTIIVAFEGADAVAQGEDYVAALPEHEFNAGRQIVADATVAAVEHAMVPTQRVTVEAELLLLDDC